MFEDEDGKIFHFWNSVNWLNIYSGIYCLHCEQSSSVRGSVQWYWDHLHFAASMAIVTKLVKNNGSRSGFQCRDKEVLLRHRKRCTAHDLACLSCGIHLSCPGEGTPILSPLGDAPDWSTSPPSDSVDGQSENITFPRTSWLLWLDQMNENVSIHVLPKYNKLSRRVKFLLIYVNIGYIVKLWFTISDLHLNLWNLPFRSRIFWAVTSLLRP